MPKLQLTPEEYATITHALNVTNSTLTTDAHTLAANGFTIRANSLHGLSLRATALSDKLREWDSLTLYRE